MITDIINNKQKIKIICPAHGVFDIRVDNHLNGRGCRKCTYERQHIGIEKFIENSKKIHHDKYDYSLVKDDYVNQRSKIKIICPIHGIFYQIAYNHSHGNGCSICKRDSNGQKTIRYYLTSNEIKFIEQKIFKDCLHEKYLFFDFYLPDYNLCIEFDGEQHFKSMIYFGGEQSFAKIKIRDKIKNNYCKNNNISLLRIKYDENIREKLDDYFSTKFL